MAAPLVDASPSLGSVNTFSRMIKLLKSADRQLQIKFLELVDGARGVRTLEQIATLLEQGQVMQALDFMDEFSNSYATAVDQVFATAGLSTADFIRDRTNTLLEFNTLNNRAQLWLRDTRQRLVREMTAAQMEATFTALQDGVRRGLRPDQLAREFRDSIGLTGKQQRAVSNYRRLLEERDSAALTRALRDKRFDSTVARAIADDVPLTQVQIDRMVDRYQEKYVKYRSEVIAHTESLGATHAGDDEMWQQAVESGAVDPETITSIWHISGLGNTRDSHSFMNMQQQPFGTPFRSGDGNNLRYPGDPSAPASDTVQCNCVVGRTIPKNNPRQP